MTQWVNHSRRIRACSTNSFLRRIAWRVKTIKIFHVSTIAAARLLTSECLLFTEMGADWDEECGDLLNNEVEREEASEMGVECLAINKDLLIKSSTCIRHISSSSVPRSPLHSFATQFQLSGSRGFRFFCFRFSFLASRVSNFIVRLRKIYASGRKLRCTGLKPSHNGNICQGSK